MSKQNPFADEDEQDIEEKPKGDELEVEVDDDDENDDSGDREEAEAAKPNRQAKKDNRWRDHTERTKRAEEEAKAAREERDRERAQTQTLILQNQQLLQDRQRQAEPQVDPLDGKISAVREQQDMLFRLYEQEQRDNRLTTESEAKYRRKAQELQDELMNLAVDKRIAAQGLARQSSPQEEAASNMRRHVQSNYPDVYEDKRAMMWADARFAQKLAEGHPRNIATANAALEDARRHFRMSGARAAPAPTEAQKRKYSGTPSGAAGGGGERPKTISMTKDHRKMARAMYPHLAEGKAFQKWANEVGSRLHEKD